MTWTKAFLLVALSAFLYAPSAEAQCELTMQSSGDTHISGYNALSRDYPDEPIRIFLENNGSELCSGFLRFESYEGSVHLSGPGQSRLNYWITEEANRNHILFEAETYQQNEFQVSLEPSIRKEINPKLIIPTGQSARSGMYTTNLDAVFTHNNFTQADTRAQIPLSVYVEASVQANFVGVTRAENSGGVSYFQLGELVPGMVRSVGLQLRANTDVDIEVSTENQGRLVNQDYGDSFIPYALSVGGESVDLSGGGRLALPSSVSPQGQTSPINIQISDFRQAAAGNYTDTILVRISGR